MRARTHRRPKARNGPNGNATLRPRGPFSRSRRARAGARAQTRRRGRPRRTCRARGRSSASSSRRRAPSPPADHPRHAEEQRAPATPPIRSSAQRSGWATTAVRYTATAPGKLIAFGMMRWLQVDAEAGTTSAVSSSAGASPAWKPILTVSAANSAAVTAATIHAAPRRGLGALPAREALDHPLDRPAEREAGAGKGKDGLHVARYRRNRGWTVGSARMPDVIVIGGGVVGTTAAWYLAEAGAEVTLLERGALASGATGRSQGLVLPPDHAELVPLWQREHRRLQPARRRARRRLLLRPHADRDAAPGHATPASSPRSTHVPAAGERARRRRRRGGRARPRARDGGRPPDRRGPAHPTPGRSRLRGGGRRGRGRRHPHARRGEAHRRAGVITDAGQFAAAMVVLVPRARGRAGSLQRSGHDVPVRPVRGWIALLGAGRPSPAPRDPRGRATSLRAPVAGPPGQPRACRPATSPCAGADPPTPWASTRTPTARCSSARRGRRRCTRGRRARRRLRENARPRLPTDPRPGGREVTATWTGLRPFSPTACPTSAVSTSASSSAPGTAARASSPARARAGSRRSSRSAGRRSPIRRRCRPTPVSASAGSARLCR